MQQLIIQGSNKLSGEVFISGSKNAALQLIPAALLAKGESVIHNVPDILDIRNLLKTIEAIGAKIEFSNNTVKINPDTINSFTPPSELVRRLRASILLAVPILSRFGKVELSYPGGCSIGARPLNYHFNAFKALGIDVIENDSFYRIEAKEIKGSLININFSVLGTGNAIMAAVFAKGETIIKLAACEPEVLNLISFLNKMGADIKWAGNHIIRIKGVSSLSGAEIKTIPDRIEGGTFALAAAATKSELLVHNFLPEHNDAFLFKLQEANIKYEISHNSLNIKRGTSIKPVNIQTSIYPGFPTDLQAPFSVLLTQASGVSRIFETIFEGRLSYLYELEKMGANTSIEDTNNATIEGPTPLYGTQIKSIDLRAGATLIIASILAEGESIIKNAEIIDRGYENIEQKFKSIGANIKRETV
jgi:UDP-N-acetylglucosamine 1-carboxyvinyltransferase